MARLRYSALTLLSLGTLVLVWYLVTALGLVSPKLLASPVAVLKELGVLLSDGYVGTPLAVHFWASLRRTLIGYSIAVIVGVPVGLLLGMNRLAYSLVAPIFALFRPIPAIAYIPLVILWLGIGEEAKVLVIFMASFLYIVLNAHAGMATVPEGLKRAAVNLGVNRVQMFTRVIIPAAMPAILTGLKTGLAVAWTVVVAAELIAAQQGLGYMIMDAATFFRIPDVYIGVLLIGIIGLVLTGILEFIEARLLHWAGK